MAPNNAPFLPLNGIEIWLILGKEHPSTDFCKNKTKHPSFKKMIKKKLRWNSKIGARAGVPMTLKNFFIFFYEFMSSDNEVGLFARARAVLGVFGGGGAPPEKRGYIWICKRSAISSSTIWYRSHFSISNRFLFIKEKPTAYRRKTRKMRALSDNPLKAIAHKLAEYQTL